MFRKQVKEDVNITINVNDDDGTHTSGEALRGQVQLRSSQALDSLSLHLTFEGSSFTCIKNTDSLHTHLGRVMGKHLFLKMTINIEDQVRTLQPGEACSVAFHLVVPSQISHSCNHTIEDGQLQAEHMQMPPSMILNRRVILEDGVTVHAAKITYGVRAVLRSGDVELARMFCPVELVPSRIPISAARQMVLCGEALFQTRSRSHTGAAKLVLETETVPIFKIPSTRDSQESTLMKVELLLRHESSMPNAFLPEISDVHIKLKSTTFYSARPFRSAPNIADSTTKGYRYLEETLLNTSITLGQLSWEPLSLEDIGTDERRRLHFSSSMTTSPSPVHTTTIFIPLALPTSLLTRIVPTFDVCLIARHYNIELNFHLPNSRGPPYTFTVPIIVSLPPTSSNASPSYAEVERLASPPDYSQDLVDDLPAYEPTDIRLVQNDGRIRTFAYVKSEPWLNIHNGFKHGYRKLKGHWEVRQARKERDM